jgi:hypothetical protein
MFGKFWSLFPRISGHTAQDLDPQFISYFFPFYFSFRARRDFVLPPRVARFFSAQNTKKGKIYKINTKCTKVQ